MCMVGLLFAQGIYYLYRGDIVKNQNNFMKRNELKQTKYKMWKENAHKLCSDYRVTSYSDVLLSFRFSADVRSNRSHTYTKSHMLTYKWLSAFVMSRSNSQNAEYKFAIITAIDIS